MNIVRGLYETFWNFIATVVWRDQSDRNSKIWDQKCMHKLQDIYCQHTFAREDRQLVNAMLCRENIVLYITQVCFAAKIHSV